jgi:hypothetical protein
MRLENYEHIANPKIQPRFLILELVREDAYSSIQPRESSWSTNYVKIAMQKLTPMKFASLAEASCKVQEIVSTQP